MNGHPVLFTALVILSTNAAWAQTERERTESVPIYRVTVIERTVRAVDYQYRNGPTKVDFRGTVLLPQAKGDATVESKRGRTEIEARFNHVPAPTRFGREYLTYVLWAISPEGHAKNLGEILPGGSDQAKLRVTTDLQAFGLIVTAEPYSAVRQPGDVVVLENEIRPDTMGRTEPIQAKFELLPRGHYTYDVPANLQAAEDHAPKLPRDRYEALLEVYQAQNAVQIALSAGAAEYAPDTFSKAQDLLRQAQELQQVRDSASSTVTMARQAAQTAEDARAIALRRKQDSDLTKAQQQQGAAEAAASQARDEAASLRAQLDQERAARDQADRQVPAPPAAPTAPTAPPVVIQQPTQTVPEAPSAPPPPQPASELRVHLYRQLNSVFETRDTPRGLVITMPDAFFHAANLNSAAYGRLANLAAIVRAQPGLLVAVEGHTDDRGDASADERISYDRANAVRTALFGQGVPRDSVSARGWGRSRPVASNATAAGREQNRRVEIVVSGPALGGMAGWERSYSVTPQR